MGSSGGGRGSPSGSAGQPSGSIGTGGGQRGGSGDGDLEGILRESMEGHDREMARERGAMAASGQGAASGSSGMGGMMGGAGGSGGPMVTIPNASGGGIGGAGQDSGNARPDGKSASDGGSEAVGGESGGGGTGTQEGDGRSGAADARPEPKVEIPEDIAKVAGSEDQVARQIREAAEQEEDPRIREALWEEYRKHMGLKAK